MVNYATEVDLERRAGESWLALTDLDNDSFADNAIVAAALESGNGAVDAYIGVRYVLPETAAGLNAMLRDTAAAIAVAGLYTGPMPEHIEKAAAAAWQRLEQISAGKLYVAGLTLRSEYPDAIDWSHDDDDRTFSAKTLEGYP